MKLTFKTEINGKPTFFPEKIMMSLDIPITHEHAKYIHSDYCKFSNGNDIFQLNPKIHTIRADKTDRWREGDDIHFIVSDKPEFQLQFMPSVKVVSIQKIKIKYTRLDDYTIARVFVDHIIQGEATWLNCQLHEALYSMDLIAKNDGFDTVNEFFEFFSEDFEGKIIHWTNLKYS